MNEGPVRRQPAVTYGITGTDTGVGKTSVTCGLTAALRARGIRARGFKPVESGAAPWDSDQLRAANGEASGTDAAATWTSIRFAEPLAPYVAAQRAGTHIDRAQLNSEFSRVRAKAEILLVEGAGGLLVPLTSSMSIATLFAEWQLRLVIVAANRLGVLNQTLLTLEAARSRRISVSALVLNHCAARPTSVAEETNAAALRSLCGDVPLVLYPYVERSDDISALAQAAESCGLVNLILSDAKHAT